MRDGRLLGWATTGRTSGPDAVSASRAVAARPGRTPSPAWYSHLGVAAVERGEPATDVLEPDPRPLRIRGVGVPGVLHHEQELVSPRGPRCGSVPPSSIWAMPWVTAFSTRGWRTQRRDGAGPHPLVRLDLVLEPVPEPHLLDGEEVLGEVQLLAERDLLARAQGQAAAQEVREKDAEAPGLVRLRRDQGVDRVEAVEEEVGVDLGPQRPQLRLPRGDLELEGAPLGLLRGLEGPQEVVERGGEEVERHAEAEQERGGLDLPGRESREAARSDRGRRAHPRLAISQMIAEMAAATSWVPRARSRRESSRGAARQTQKDPRPTKP